MGMTTVIVMRRQPRPHQLLSITITVMATITATTTVIHIRRQAVVKTRILIHIPHRSPHHLSPALIHIHILSPISRLIVTPIPTPRMNTVTRTRILQKIPTIIPMTPIHPSPPPPTPATSRSKSR